MGRGQRCKFASKCRGRAAGAESPGFTSVRVAERAVEGQKDARVGG